MPFLQKIKNIALLGIPIVLTTLLMSGLFHSLVGASPAAPQVTNVSGTITQDTSWTAAESPYLLVDDVVVSEGVTLTVEPGVTVLGQTNFSLRVLGMLQAIGEPSLPITFTANAESWPGIYFGHYLDADPERGNGRLEHAVVSKASNGITLLLVDENDELILDNTIIRDSESHPIVVLSDSLQNLSLSQTAFIDNGNPYIRVHLWFAIVDTNVTLTPHQGVLGYEFTTHNTNRFLTVEEGVTLTVKPGVELLFNEGVGLGVNGGLEAIGLPDKPITFTGSSSWQGIWFGGYDDLPLKGNGRLEHVTISNADRGILVILIDESDRVIVKNTVIRNSKTYGIDLASSSLHKLDLSQVTHIDNGKNYIHVQLFPTHTLTADITLLPHPGLKGYEFDVSEPADFILKDGVNFTVHPGVGLIFQEDLGLIVEGNLEAMGLPDNPITFTGDIDWIGLSIGSETEGGNGRLAYTHISNAKTGISVTNPLIGESSTLSMTHVTLDANGTGLNVVRGEVDGECTAVTHNTNGIMIGALTAPQVNLQKSIISGNLNYGVTNLYPASVDLRHSWWGAAAGPGGDGPGSGDALFGDVLYALWRESGGCDVGSDYRLYVPMVIRP